MVGLFLGPGRVSMDQLSGLTEFLERRICNVAGTEVLVTAFCSIAAQQATVIFVCTLASNGNYIDDVNRFGRYGFHWHGFGSN